MKRYILIFSLLLISCQYQDSLISDIAKDQTKVMNINKWPDGQISYFFDQKISKKEIKIIKECMLFYSQKTHIKFIEKDQKLDYCLFIKKINNKIENQLVSSSTIGFKKNPIMKLGCFLKTTIFHELGHVIGLTHEHQRPDRDNYIIIHKDNIIKNKKHNFDIIINPLVHYTIYQYDVYSIMHYTPYMCSANKKPVFEFVDDSIWVLRNSPTKLDFQKINDIYSD